MIRWIHSLLVLALVPSVCLPARLHAEEQDSRSAGAVFVMTRLPQQVSCRSDQELATQHNGPVGLRCCTPSRPRLNQKWILTDPEYFVPHSMVLLDTSAKGLRSS
jgi:hypothetical protein